MTKLYLLLLIALVAIQTKAQDSTLSDVDIPPLFEGCNDPLISKKQQQECSAPKIQAFIHQHISYPDSAKVHATEGVVVVRFVVNEEGLVSQLELIRDIGNGCGQEAMRVVRMMPQFTPALHNGNPVSTKMTLPIRFRKIDESQKTDKNLYQLHWGPTYSNFVSKEALKHLQKHPLVIRDYYGNLYDIESLNLKLITKNKTHETKSKGNNLSPESLKMLKKAKATHLILFEATIKKNYQNIKVVRQLVLK